MEKKDQKMFTQLLTGLAEVCNSTMSEQKIMLYFEALKDLDFNKVKAAANMLAQTWKIPNTCPLPAHFRETISGSKEDLDSEAELAWVNVHKAIRSSSDRSVDFGNGYIHATIIAMGGWIRLSDTPIDEMTWVKKDFLQIYKAYRKRGQPPQGTPDHLAGELEKGNSEAGYGKETKERLGLPEWVSLGFEVAQVGDEDLMPRRITAGKDMKELK